MFTYEVPFESTTSNGQLYCSLFRDFHKAALHPLQISPSDIGSPFGGGAEKLAENLRESS
jgi:hypothetical protein